MNVIRLARWMNGRGHRNVILCRRDSPLYSHAGKENLRCRMVNPSVKYFDFFEARRLKKIVAEERLDVLCIHSSKDINPAVVTRHFFSPQTKLLYIQHMQLGIEKKDLLHTWEFNTLDGWISPLPFLRENVLRFTRMKSDRIHVIPFGIDLAQYSSKLKKEEVRAYYGLPAHDFVCGVVGRIDYGKGQEYLIRAIAFLKARSVIIHGLIVGAATADEARWYEEKLHALCHELGVSELIHFHPFDREVTHAYTAMNLFCLTSISETYGMVTIEAMAMRLPIIATNSAGTPDIIQDGENGLLVPPQNEEALAHAILKIKSDSAFAENLSTRARKDVEEKFTHTRQCELMEGVFDSLSGVKNK